MESVASIAEIWRYPVKSMQGEPVPATALTARGVLGDRVYALREVETGHIVSAKHARKWGRVFECRAEFLLEPTHDSPASLLRITLPDGKSFQSDDPNIDDALSEWVGRPVELIAQAPETPIREANRAPAEAEDGVEAIREEPMGAASPAGTFFDYAPIHLLTTATLDYFRRIRPASAFAASRFRPNLLLESEAEGQVENGWLGRQLIVGSAILYLIDPSVRCIVTTLAQGSLPRDPEILRTVAKHGSGASVTAAPGIVLPAVAGVYAQVAQNGTIRVGETVNLLDGTPHE